MTREEIMENRILPKDVVDDIATIYQQDNSPTWEEMTGDNQPDEDEVAQREYISNERIQRMTPEEILDILIGYPKYEVKDSNSLIRMLSVATGRTEDELRNAIFGMGDFDTRKFYQPTEKQKTIIKAIFSIAKKLNKAGIKWHDYRHWTQECKDDWNKAFEDVPEEAVPSEMEEINGYIQYYLKHGIPLWLH